MSSRTLAMLAAYFVLPATGSSAATFQTVYAFPGSARGVFPQSGLTRSGNVFFGVTLYGGTGPCKVRRQPIRGCGAVFRLTGGGGEHVLHTFDITDGLNPTSALLSNSTNLYGTTYAGGSSADGTVFYVTQSGDFHTIHNFAGGGGDGKTPVGSLAVMNNLLYGVTEDGGAHSAGTVYSMALDGSNYQVLHSFGGTGDGNGPSAGLIAVDGVLYGTTQTGGAGGDGGNGTIYSITADGTETVLHAFAGGADGSDPQSALTVLHGKLYGTTAHGGAAGCDTGCGTVFSIKPAGGYAVVAELPSGDDNWPGTLAALGGVLYGTTTGGGANDQGSLFSVTTDGIYTTLYSFVGGSASGSSPGNTPIAVSGKSIWDVTELGGDLSCGSRGGSGCGTVFSYTP